MWLGLRSLSFRECWKGTGSSQVEVEFTSKMETLVKILSIGLKNTYYKPFGIRTSKRHPRICENQHVSIFFLLDCSLGKMSGGLGKPDHAGRIPFGPWYRQAFIRTVRGMCPLKLDARIERIWICPQRVCPPRFRKIMIKLIKLMIIYINNKLHFCCQLIEHVNASRSRRPPSICQRRQGGACLSCLRHKKSKPLCWHSIGISFDPLGRSEQASPLCDKPQWQNSSGALSARRAAHEVQLTWWSLQGTWSSRPQVELGYYSSLLQSRHCQYPNYPI